MVKNIINSLFSGPAYDKYSDERTRAYTESPTTFDYNIDANKAAGQFVADRTQELLGNNPISKGIGILGQAASVPVGFYSSFAHEAAQAKDRMQPGSGAKGFYDAFMDENPLSTAAQRAGGILSSIPGIGDAVYNMGAKAYDVLNSPMGTAQAAEVTPQTEPMDIEDFLGTSTPRDLGFIGNAPTVKEAVGITDRGRGMTGPAVEMIGGQAVPVGDVLGRQMALEKADFVEETPRGLAALAQNFNPLAFAAGLINPALGFAINMGSRARSGLGSLGSKLADFRERTTGYRTQAAYEQARAERSAQSRTDRMIDRISKGKRTRSNPRDAGTTQAQKDAISAALQDKQRGAQYGPKGDQGSGGSTKIVCTMMNERYGFGSFRNKIWMKFHESYGPEYQKGYHAIFLPLVKIAKGEGKINTAVRKVLEHMGRHVTADMFKIMKGKKRDPLGRIYRAIFEPTCHIIGKIKSALGRG